MATFYNYIYVELYCQLREIVRQANKHSFEFVSAFTCLRGIKGHFQCSLVGDCIDHNITH